jgi:hypothetical protein
MIAAAEFQHHAAERFHVERQHARCVAQRAELEDTVGIVTHDARVGGQAVRPPVERDLNAAGVEIDAGERHGYAAGWRHGVGQALLAGLLMGALAMYGGLQLATLLGWVP